MLENSNDYQIVSTHRLYQVQFDYERAQRISMELTLSLSATHIYVQMYLSNKSRISICLNRLEKLLIVC